MADSLFSASGDALGVVRELADLASILSVALKVVRNHNPDSTIVLSFRALQAQRIEALQQDIVRWIGRSLDELNEHTAATEGEPGRDLIEWQERTDERIDNILHRYGSVYTSVMLVYI
jgi:hypothetical protein